MWRWPRPARCSTTVRAAGDEHHGELAARGGDRLHAEHGAGEDQAVDAELEERVERALLGGGAEVDGADDGAVPLGAGGLLDAVDDLGEERIVEVGEDD